MARLIRGPDRDFIVADMREAMEREVARGVPSWRARLRFFRDVLASAVSTWRVYWRPEWPVFSWLDVKLGWRMLWKYPLLTTVSLFSLAIGIPVGFAPAHVVDAIDGELPVMEGQRVRTLRFRRAGIDGGPSARVYDFLAWQESLTTFETLAAVHWSEYSLDVGSGAGIPVSAAHVTGEGFRVVRIAPLLGRALEPSDMGPAAAPVVVLGFDLWQARLGGDPDVMGRTVRLAGVPHTVVGVMPAGFHFPVNQELWLPLQVDPSAEPGQGPGVTVFGRLADGVSEREAQAEVAAVDARLHAAAPDVYDRLRTEVVSFPALFVGFPKEGMRSMPVLRVLDLLGLVLLALACANVGLLIFARTATRASDMAVRSALGASRMRIVGQVCTEALVLALLAAGVGVLLVDVLGNVVMTMVWAPDWGRIPWWIDLGATPKTVVRALTLAVLSAGAAALVPALRVTGRAVHQNMRQAEARRSGIRFGGLSTVLIVLDVAVAVGALGLVAAISTRLSDMESGRGMTGLPADRYLAAEIRLPLSTGLEPSAGAADRSDADRLAELQRELVVRLESESGVHGVAVASRLPRMDHGGGRIEVERSAGEDSLITHRVFTAQVAPGYFEALGTNVLTGRDFVASDLTGSRSAAIVNTSFSERVLGGQNPVGRRIRFLPRSVEEEPGSWLEVVGVVPDLGVNLFDPVDSEAVYRPAAPGEIDPFWVAVAVTADPGSFAPRLREIVSAVDPGVLLRQPQPLSAFYPEDRYLAMGMAVGWTLLVVILLAMAASGIYAIMSFSVTQRTREIGIRAALGARRGHIVATIGRRAGLQLGTGVVLGMPMAGWLFFMLMEDPSATHAAWIAGVVPGLAVLLVVGAAACAAPLRRALRITPNDALREG